MLWGNSRGGGYQDWAGRGQRSLIGKIFGEKKVNFLGIKSTMMKIWQHRGLSKVVALGQNAFQFVFTQSADRDAIL